MKYYPPPWRIFLSSTNNGVLGVGHKNYRFIDLSLDVDQHVTTITINKQWTLDREKTNDEIKSDDAIGIVKERNAVAALNRYREAHHHGFCLTILFRYTKMISIALLLYTELGLVQSI